MRRAALLALGLGLVLGVPAQARPAKTGFDYFREVCVATAADPAKALAKADATGWGATTDLPRALKIDSASVEGRGLKIGAARYVLGTTRKAMGEPPVAQNFCMMGGNIGQKGLIEQLTALTGGPGFAVGGTGAGGRVFAWRDGPRGPVPVPGSAPLNAAIGARDTTLRYVIVYKNTDTFWVIGLVVPVR
jgi:hypothetical protein